MTSRATALVVAGAVWLALAWFAAATGLLLRSPQEPPLRVGLAVGVPVVAVCLALLWPSARAWARSIDLPLLINLHAIRAAGFAFLILYGYGLLPGGFAIPAGLGDLVSAVTAPFLAAHVARRGRAWRTLTLAWSAFGILDFALALALGIGHDLAAGVAGSTAADAPMAFPPLSLIPTFAVPYLLVIHLLVLPHVIRRSPRHPSANPSPASEA